MAEFLFFFETDCPTCRLMAPYLNAFGDRVDGISQDPGAETEAFVEQLGIRFPVRLDAGLAESRKYDPEFVPALYRLDASGVVTASWIGFAKADLNSLGEELGLGEVASPFDGNPGMKPGCTSRQREVLDESEPAAAPVPVAGGRASRIEVGAGEDAWELTRTLCRDPLPVVPPTVERVERMIQASGLPPDQVIALVAPNYGPATVEKIAANAVMAGCDPSMMRVLIPLVRAACDERFNLHGVVATTHFAAPLIVINGPIRNELGFHSAGNVFSNVARANSTLGRAFQLIATNLGGGRPAEIDMSTLGNPAKFSQVIAEAEELSPWEPYHVEHGFAPSASTLTLFAAEPMRGISEHVARRATVLLDAIAANLATIWSPRVCRGLEAFVVVGPEHVKTLFDDGFSKEDVRRYLFDHTGIPVRRYGSSDAGEGNGGAGGFGVGAYEEIHIHGELCYRKFRNPQQIQIIVAGGTAGKFSAVLGSWVTGEKGAEMVTYPIP